MYCNLKFSDPRYEKKVGRRKCSRLIFDFGGFHADPDDLITTIKKKLNASLRLVAFRVIKFQNYG